MLLIKSAKWGAVLTVILLLGLSFTDRAVAGDCHTDVGKLVQYRNVTMQIVHEMMTKMSCKAMRTDVFCPLWGQLQKTELDVLDSMISCRSTDSQIQQMKASILKGDEFAKKYCPFMNSAL